jgi:hypothetical protein
MHDHQFWLHRNFVFQKTTSDKANNFHMIFPFKQWTNPKPIHRMSIKTYSISHLSNFTSYIFPIYLTLLHEHHM